jgi:dihydrofolate reductase
MRKLIYAVAASLDGYLARRDGAIDWLPVSRAKEDDGRAKFIAGVDTLVIGRKSYEQMLSRGPWTFGTRACYVRSRRWTGQRDVHAEFTALGAAALLRRIRRRPGRNIWLVGGGESAHGFLAAGLVDEFVVTFVPVLLGEGLPLFLPHPAETKLVLRGTRIISDGLVQLRYTVRAARRR